MSITSASVGMENALQYKTMLGHTMEVYDAVYLRDGQYITCSRDGSLRLWNQESGAQIGNDLRDGAGGVRTIALSPGGKVIAAGSEDGTVRLWDMETGKVIAKWTGHTKGVRSVCWSADGERVASGSYDGTVRVWSVESGDGVLRPIKTGHEYVLAVAYSPDTSKFATGGYNEDAIKIWDATTGKLLSTLEQGSSVWSLAWTSDQKKLIAGFDNGSIRIFNFDSTSFTFQQIAVLEDHKDSVTAISLFQNDRLLASASLDNTARIWDLDTNLPVGSPMQHQDYVYGAAFSADGNFLVTACQDTNAYVWDVHSIPKKAGNKQPSPLPLANVSIRASCLELNGSLNRVTF